MPDFAFPTDFTINLPTPLPPISPWGGFPQVSVFFLFGARMSSDTIGNGSMQFGFELKDGVIDTPIQIVQITPFGINVNISVLYDAGNLHITMTCESPDWFFGTSSSNSNQVIMDVYGDNIFPWDLENYVASGVNNISGAEWDFIADNNGEAIWTVDGIGNLRSHSAFRAYAYLNSSEPVPPPYTPNDVYPPVGGGVIYRLPCFTPCIPHTIRRI